MATATPPTVTPPTVTPGTSAFGPLPPVMLADAAKRMAWLFLGIAILVPVIQIAQWLMQHELYLAMMNDISRLMSVITILSAVGIFALHRYKVASASAILWMGLGLEIFGAFTIALIETAVPIRGDQPVLGISKLGPWIVAFGVFIPNRPMWTLVFASASAATWPLAYAINAARFDFPPTPIGLLGVWPLFNLLMVVLTYYIGRQTYGMALAAETAVELGSYRLVSPIGEGGMGEVWKARHQMLARTAAIKLMRTGSTGVSGRQAEVGARRFRREANAIAELQSPHTVYLYDFGVSQDGRFYYVMELLDGVSLQTLVSSFGPQSPERVVSILRQICRSLDEAHHHGIVHRDLKPSNVMLCRVAFTYDFVKVLDFGLAKSMGSDEVSQLTMEGMATGTPGYIAPEVALGHPSVDGRADLYALGCVAYFLLTGTLVFDDPNPMSLALKHVQAPPPPPSERTELPIPPALERLVLDCLAKSPEDRPANAREVEARLAACGIAKWTQQDADAWWQRHLPATSSLRSFAQAAPYTPPVVRKV